MPKHGNERQIEQVAQAWRDGVRGTVDVENVRLVVLEWFRMCLAFLGAREKKKGCK